MATSSHSRSLVSSVKRLKLSTPTTPTTTTIQTRPITHTTHLSASPSLSTSLSTLRLPLSVQATYLSPLKRTPTHSHTSADLHLHSYSLRNLELFADFALRAAYYLSLPAKGPIPLPKKTERWTVPRSNFVHKKSQENFERITMKRWVRIVDGHPETVAVWLAFLRKYQYYGVGMKADVWEDGALGGGKEMEEEGERVKEMMGEGGELEIFVAGNKGVRKGKKEGRRAVLDQVGKGAWGADAVLGGAWGARSAKGRFEKYMPEQREEEKEEKGRGRRE